MTGEGSLRKIHIDSRKDQKNRLFWGPKRIRRLLFMCAYGMGCQIYIVSLDRSIERLIREIRSIGHFFQSK
jgi:hypothetical protein